MPLELTTLVAVSLEPAILAAAIALLLPPVSLVFVALIGLWIERRHRPIGRFLAWFGVLALLVLALPAVSGLLLTSLERNLPLTPPPDRPPLQAVRSSHPE